MTTLVLAAIAVVAVILLERVFNRFFPRLLAAWLGRTIGKIALAQQPDRLHLDPVSADSWSDFETASDLGRPFTQQGFESAGTFRVTEMPGVIVQLLAHPAQRLYGRSTSTRRPATGSTSSRATRTARERPSRRRRRAASTRGRGTSW